MLLKDREKIRRVEDALDDKISIGNIVHLKSGSPDLKVVKQWKEGNKGTTELVTVTWQTGFTKQQTTFPMTSVTKVR